MKSLTASIIIASSDVGDGNGSISKIIRFSLTIDGLYAADKYQTTVLWSNNFTKLINLLQITKATG